MKRKRNVWKKVFNLSRFTYSKLNLCNYENDENGTELIETFEVDTIEDPLETIMKKEYYENVQTEIEKNLSKFEKQVLDRFIKGESYNVIAKKQRKDDSHV